MRFSIALLSIAAVLPASASAENGDHGRAAFRAIYEEMVEIDSSPTTGSCTKVVRATESRLRAAGFTGDDVQVVIPDGKPEDGNIVARIRAPGATKKGVLLLAHIDVVDARRADWERDPFTLDRGERLLLRPRRGRRQVDGGRVPRSHDPPEAGTRLPPKRDLIMALTCGEETSNRVNGVDYLLEEQARAHRRRIRASTKAQAGCCPTDGKPLVLQVQAGEKIHQVYDARGDQPGRSLVAARTRQRDLSPGCCDAEGRAAIVSDRGHAGRARILPRHGAAARRRDRRRDARGREESRRQQPRCDADERSELQRQILHTTCVATQLDAGHAANALPQRATATLSCRVMQGTTPEQVKERL